MVRVDQPIYIKNAVGEENACVPTSVYACAGVECVWWGGVAKRSNGQYLR
jgi:hypothetical protein